jgi:AcrR family transcriptional regulator
MPKPSTPPARQRLLDAGLELFTRQGFNATKTDQIITQADTKPPTLYRNYGGKDGVIVAAVEHFDQELRERLADELARHDTPRAKLLAMFDFLEGWLTERDWRGWLAANAAIEFADTDHPVHQVVARHRQALRALFHDVAVGAGADDPAALAAQVQVLVDGAMIGAIIDRGPGPVRAARAQVEILLGAAGTAEQ